MLWTIGLILMAVWLLGLLAHVGGALIYVVFVAATSIIVYEFIKGRREDALQRKLEEIHAARREEQDNADIYRQPSP